jgi:L-ascorbate metabolism protein UlaG (beta-lactamase superfamily)
MSSTLPHRALAVITVASLWAPASIRAQGGQDAALTIEYIAHASFVVESSGGTRVLLDPYADAVWLGYTFPRTVQYDVVAITHPHYDHDGGEFRGLDTPWPEGTPVYRDPGRHEVGDVRLEGLNAKHADPYGKEFGQKNVVWVLEADGIRIAHIGDNGPLTPQLVEAMGRIDVLMLPIDGEEHILTYDAVGRILEEVRPRYVVPMHYRIAELEPGDGPSDLGPIEPWLEGREGVRRLGSNVWRVGRSDGEGGVIVFEPSPAVPRAGGR